MRDEVVRVLARLGDTRPAVRWTAVEGIAVVTTSLDARAVVRRCRELFRALEEPFDFTRKWLPVDGWCATDLDAIKRLVDAEAAPRIGPGETWALRVRKRRWQRYHTAKIVHRLAAGIEREVDLARPDKIVWIDVIGKRTAVSVLRPEEIFSAAVEPAG